MLRPVVLHPVVLRDQLPVVHTVQAARCQAVVSEAAWEARWEAKERLPSRPSILSQKKKWVMMVPREPRASAVLLDLVRWGGGLAGHTAQDPAVRRPAQLRGLLERQAHQP